MKLAESIKYPMPTLDATVSEGVAVKGGRLFAGFRGPSLDNGRAAILSVTLGGLFGTEPADPKLYLLPLGNGQGVRDLASYTTGFPLCLQ